LTELKEEADKNILLGNKEINKLIRDDKIKADTASSLVNDHDNVNSLIKNLIEVAELLYGHKDPLVESGIKKEKEKKRKAA
jgi:phosphate:Na+ symporter